MTSGLFDNWRANRSLQGLNEISHDLLGDYTEDIYKQIRSAAELQCSRINQVLSKTGLASACYTCCHCQPLQLSTSKAPLVAYLVQDLSWTRRILYQLVTSESFDSLNVVDQAHQWVWRNPVGPDGIIIGSTAVIEVSAICRGINRELANSDFTFRCNVCHFCNPELEELAHLGDSTYTLYRKKGFVPFEFYPAPVEEEVEEEFDDEPLEPVSEDFDE